MTPPLERDAAHLWDMLDAARQAQAFAAGLDARGLVADRLTCFAVERALEIIGEAARRVSPSTRDAHPEVPWAGIIGFRNVIAHEYGAIDYQRLFTVVAQGVPALIAALETMVASFGDDT